MHRLRKVKHRHHSSSVIAAALTAVIKYRDVWFVQLIGQAHSPIQLAPHWFSIRAAVPTWFPKILVLSHGSLGTTGFCQGKLGRFSVCSSQVTG